MEGDQEIPPWSESVWYANKMTWTKGTWGIADTGRGFPEPPFAAIVINPLPTSVNQRRLICILEETRSRRHHYTNFARLSHILSFHSKFAQIIYYCNPRLPSVSFLFYEKDCIRQFFLFVTNTWQKQCKRRKDLFWLTVSVVSFHGQLILLFLGYGEAEHHGRRKWLSKVAHLILARKQRGVGWGRTKNKVYSEHTPIGLLPPTRLSLLPIMTSYYETIRH
jgi:hypothetical protein